MGLKLRFTQVGLVRRGCVRIHGEGGWSIDSDQMVYTVIKSMEKATRDGDDEYSDERPLQSSHATAERGSRTARTEESRVRRTKSNPAVRKRQQAEGMGRAKRRLFDSAPELLSRRKKNNQPWRCLAGPAAPFGLGGNPGGGTVYVLLRITPSHCLGLHKLVM